MSPSTRAAALLTVLAGVWSVGGCGSQAPPEVARDTAGGDKGEGALRCGDLTRVTPAQGPLAGQTLCVGVASAGEEGRACPAAAPTRFDAGPFFACLSPGSPAPSEEILGGVLDAACGGTAARAVVVGGEPYCVVGDRPQDGPGCPSHLPHAGAWHDLLVCGRARSPRTPRPRGRWPRAVWAARW